MVATALIYSVAPVVMTRVAVAPRPKKIVAAAREVANRATVKSQCVPAASRAKRHRGENKLLGNEVASLRKQHKQVNVKSVQTGLAGGKNSKKVQKGTGGSRVCQYTIDEASYHT